MNSSIRKIALGLGIAFAVLLASLNYVQLGRARDLSADKRNRRNAFDEQGVKRGEILAADGTVLAESIPSGDNQFKWSRRYPTGSLFGQITGYYTSPFFCDSAGIEATQSDLLSGRLPQTATTYTDELLGKKRTGNVLKLTLDPGLQRLARNKLGRQRGGAAVINTDTGAVLALYGNPSYDPNIITREKLGDCQIGKQRLVENPNNVLLSRAYQVRYPPGSTFKIITASAGLELGGMTTSTSFPSFSRLPPCRSSRSKFPHCLPDTDKSLGNFGGETCGGSILRSFEVSCNTTFAQVGLRIGREKLVKMAERFGIDTDLNFDLRAIPSCLVAPIGNECETPDAQNLARPFVAYSSIGQQNVRMTPLQMAVAGATVGNGGFKLRPYVVQTVFDPTGKKIQTTKPDRTRILSKKTAIAMRKLMLGVVRAGTGRVVHFKYAGRGIIGGKTGTAQTGRPNDPPHVWFVAWGPHVAVAVVVEHGGDLRSEATGGKVAGPIAKALLEAVLAKQGLK